MTALEWLTLGGGAVWYLGGQWILFRINSDSLEKEK